MVRYAFSPFVDRGEIFHKVKREKMKEEKMERKKGWGEGGKRKEKEEEGRGVLLVISGDPMARKILLYKTVQTISLLKIKGNSALIFLFNNVHTKRLL